MTKSPIALTASAIGLSCFALAWCNPLLLAPAFAFTQIAASLRG